LDEVGAAAPEKREADAIDRREVGAALGHRLEASLVRAGHGEGAKEGRAARDRGDRGAEQVHAGVAVRGVERGGRAAELAELAARIGGRADDEASLERALASGERIF